MIGTRIGPYQVVARLGEGGIGEFYRAVDSNLKRAVALKVLPESVARDSDRLARLQREAEVLASLNHPNIAAIYGLERTNGTTGLVMELVEGETLDALIRDTFERRRPASGSGSALERGQVAPSDISEWALPIVRQIVDALEYAHENGIVHRDLKPANIKVRSDGTVKVLDFGFAKALGTDRGLASHSGAGSGSSDPAPTLTSPAMTQVGMISRHRRLVVVRGLSIAGTVSVWVTSCARHCVHAAVHADGQDVLQASVVRLASARARRSDPGRPRTSMAVGRGAPTTSMVTVGVRPHAATNRTGGSRKPATHS